MSTDYGGLASNLVLIGAGYGLATKMIGGSSRSRRRTVKKKSKKHRKVMKRIKA